MFSPSTSGSARFASTLLATLVVFGLIAAACGDDDGDTSAGSATSVPAEPDTGGDDTDTGDDTGTDTATGGDVDADFCTAGPAVDAAVAPEEPDPAEVQAALDIAAAAAPEELGAAVETVATTYNGVLETEDFSLLFSDEFIDAQGQINGYYVDECGMGEMSVTAVNYEYSEIPSTFNGGGDTVVNLVNDGSEFHEAIVFRINDDVEMSVEELLNAGEEVVGTSVTEVGGVFAAPGTTGAAVLDLTEPGRYAFVCFLPTGMTPDVLESGVEPEGPPHFTEGMFAEVQVEV